MQNNILQTYFYVTSCLKKSSLNANSAPSNMYDKSIRQSIQQVR